MPDTRGCLNFLWQSHIWNNSCNWNPHLIQFSIIGFHSPISICYLHRQNSRIEWNPPPLHLSSPWWWQQSLHSRNVCYLWFTIIKGRGRSSDFHFALFSLHCQVHAGILRVLCRGSNHSGARKVIRRWPTVRQTLAKTPSVIWQPQFPTLTSDHRKYCQFRTMK